MSLIGFSSFSGRSFHSFHFSLSGCGEIVNYGGENHRLIADLAKGMKSATMSHVMPKRTYQPKTRKRARVHGFRARMATRAGQVVLKRRRNKARRQIAV